MTGGAVRESPAFVTGASGFLGRHLVRALLGAGREVYALCREPEGMAELVHPRLRLLAGSLPDAEAYREALGPATTVFHLAGVRPFPGVTSAELRGVNVAATAALGRLAAERRVARFVALSTAGIFEPAEPGAPADESCDLRPAASATTYLRSRLEGFRALTTLADAGLPLVTLLPTIVFGPDRPDHPNPVTGYTRFLLRVRLDAVVGGGAAPRDLVFVKDVVAGILAAEAKGRLGAAYILGGEALSHREFNRRVLALAGRRPLLSLSLPISWARRMARRGDRQRGFEEGAGYRAAIAALTAPWRYSSGKAAAELGYRPRPFAAGMEETLAFLRAERP